MYFLFLWISGEIGVCGNFWIFLEFGVCNDMCIILKVLFFLINIKIKWLLYLYKFYEDKLYLIFFIYMKLWLW